MSKLQQDFTSGPIGKQLFSFAMPFLAANLLQALYGAVDMLVVGNYASPDPVICTAALSGVNIGGQITHVLTMLVSGLTTAGTVMLGQYLGAGQPEEGKKTVGTTLSVLGLLGIAITGIMLLLAGPFLHLLQTPSDSFDYALEYLNICLVGTIFIFGYNAISAIQRGMGDSLHPLLFVGIACVVNIVLDLVFVKNMGMGVAGAAWATVIAQGLSLIIAAIYLARHSFVFDFKPGSFRIYGEKVKMMFKIGIPSSIQSVIINISFLIVTSVVNTIGGVIASAAVGVVGKLNSFAILPGVAMSSSVSAYAAQNIGARQYDRAQKGMWIAFWIAMVFGTVVFVLFQLFPGQVIGIFTQDSQTVDVGIVYMRMLALDYIIVPLQFCLNGLILGAGHTMYTMISSILSSVLIRIPLVYLLGGSAMGMAGVGLAVPLATVSGTLVSGWFYLSGRWRKDRTGIGR